MFHSIVIRRPVLGAILLGMLIAMQACTGSGRTGEGVTGLPYAEGETFSTLDEYLAYLERRSVVDVPYYKEVEPGIYERQIQVRRPGETPERRTRAELEREFGFAQ